MDSSIISDKRVLWAIALAIGGIYVYGLFIPLMDNDSAHHASIALHMHLTGNYAFLVDNGQPYLDKPHMLFWLAAFSYKIFGVTTFAYKFPSLLFSLLGIYSTLRLGSLLYDKPTGRLAAIILATSFAFVISNNDVRMEGILTGSIIFSVWQLCMYVNYKKAIYLVLAALGLAIGFSTKGWIGAVIPAIALLIHLLHTCNWRMLFHWQWILLVLLFGLFISPVLYSYYLQYNCHPETVVRGHDHINGVKFILWNQNIQRMSGESHGHTRPDYLFFFHTFLWAFLPWSILGGIAIVSRVKKIFARKPGPHLTEVLSFGTVIFFMVLFSFSSYKLPHYLNCLFPFYSLLLAGFLTQNSNYEKKMQAYWWVQVVTVTIAVMLAILLTVWVFPVNQVWKWIVLIILFIAYIGAFGVKRDYFDRQFLLTISGILFFFAALNINFYPRLLTYQAGNELAFKSESEHPEPSNVYHFMEGDYSSSYDFYTAYLHSEINIDQVKEVRAKKTIWLITSEEGLATLKANGLNVGKIYSNEDYRVSVLKFSFINPATRKNAMTTTYLVQLL